MHERVRGWDQGVTYIRTGFPAQSTSCQRRNSGVTFANRGINEHVRGEMFYRSKYSVPGSGLVCHILHPH